MLGTILFEFGRAGCRLCVLTWTQGPLPSNLCGFCVVRQPAQSETIRESKPIRRSLGLCSGAKLASRSSDIAASGGWDSEKSVLRSRPAFLWLNGVR